MDERIDQRIAELKKLRSISSTAPAGARRRLRAAAKEDPAATFFV